MRVRIKRGIAPIVMLAMLASACGSDDDETTASTATPTTVATSVADTAAPVATSDASTVTASDDTATDDTATDDTATDDTATDDTATDDTGGESAGDTGTCTADKAGGTLTYGSPSQPAGLDPVKVTGTEAAGVTAIAQIYDTLMQLDPETSEYVPRVAESLEPDDTFTSWTLTLRDGVNFGNGDPLTADAVKSSIERFKELATGPYANLTKKITAMDVTDESTLVFTLDQPWSGFPITLAIQPGMIVNTAVADAAGDAFASNPEGAGVGAYDAETFTAGEITVLKAKTDYWDGPVCIDELRFVPLPSDQARLEAFETGEFDVTWLRDPLLVEQTADENGFGLYVNGSNVFLMNAGVGPASPANDVRIRQGLELALDTNAINERANEGAGDADGAIVGDGSRLESDGEPVEPDVEAARALFDAAKADGWDGTLRFICDAGREEVALAIKAQAEAAGATLNLETVPTFAPLIDAVITKKDFDTACWGLNISDEQPWVGFSNSMYSTSPSNYGGAKDTEMDAAIDALRIATTDEDTSAALTTIQERWNEVVPSVPLLGAESRTIYSDRVSGIEQTSNTMSFFDDAYITS